MTSDHVKELTEEVEKLTKENVGEVKKKVREREMLGRGHKQRQERENKCMYMYAREGYRVCKRERERGGRGVREREYPGVDITCTSTAAFLLLYCCVACTLLPR